MVNSLASDFDVDLYITGSNSRIYTLSFGEYLTFKSQYAPLEDGKTELAHNIRLGGFPATHLQS